MLWKRQIKSSYKTGPRPVVFNRQNKVVPVLITALKNNNSSIRAKAAIVPGELGPKAAPAVPALVAALTDTHYETRSEAAYALGNLGEIASPAIPELITALADPNPSVRNYVIWSLEKMVKNFPDLVLPPLRKTVQKHPSQDVRKRAQSILDELGRGELLTAPSLLTLSHSLL